MDSISSLQLHAVFAKHVLMILCMELLVAFVLQLASIVFAHKS